MEFVEGTNINPSLTIADKTNYNSYPLSTKAVDTTIILNQLVDSLASQQAGQGTFITKDQPQTISASHTFTGNVNFTGGLSGISKDEVGLGNVDNTSDINKPISTLQQQALTNLQNSKSNLVGGNVFSGVQTFNSYPVLGGSYTAPTTNLQLVPKKFIDDNCLLIGSTNQVISGTKTFNNIVVSGNEFNNGNVTIGDALTDLLTINSTTKVNNVNLTPSQFSNIQYLDNTTSNIKVSIDAKTTLSAVQSNSNVWTNNNSFNDYLPTSNLTPSLSNQLITKQYCDQSIADIISSAPATLNTLNELAIALGNDSNFSTTMTNLIATKSGLTSNNFYTGTNIYTDLPSIISDVIPTDNKQLIPKKYCDDTFVKLGSNNILTGVQNFNNNVVIGDGAGSDLMTINCNILSNSQIITPVVLSKVRFLSNITTDVFTSLANKASLTGNNNYFGEQTFTNCYVNGFMQLKDGVALEITNSRQFIHKDYADGQYLNKTGGNSIEGNQILNGWLTVDNVTLSPIDLKKVIYLHDIDSNIKEQLESKSSLNDANIFDNANTFKSIPLLFSDLNPDDLTNPNLGLLSYGQAKSKFISKGSDNTITSVNNVFSYLPKTATDLIPSDDKQLVPLKFSNDTYCKLSSNNNYTGINSFNDLTRIYGNVLVDSKTITPAMLGNTSLLSGVSSNIQDQLNSKTTLSNVLTSSNTFTNQNVFNGVSMYNNDVQMKDLFLSGSTNRTIQFVNASNTVLGKIECDVNSQEMLISTPQTKDIKFITGLSTVVGKINKTGTPSDSTDLCTKAYVDKLKNKPTSFFYGNNAQSVSPIDLSIGQIFIYFPTTRLIHNITLELSYNVSYGTNINGSQLNNNNANSLALCSVYNLVVNNSTITEANPNASYTLKYISGSTNILSVSTFLKPWQLGISGGRVSLVYQLQPTGYSNLTTNSTWVTNFSVGARIISSTTNGVRCLYPDDNSSETIGAYFSLE